MLTDITLGQYFPGNSLLHRMDARVKIVLLFFYILAIFVLDNNYCYALNTAFALAAIKMSKIPPVMVLKSIKPMWWILLFTFIIQMFTIPGETLCKLWIFNLTYEGIVRGIKAGAADSSIIPFDVYHIAPYADRCAGDTLCSTEKAWFSSS